MGYNRGALPLKRKKKTDSLTESTDRLDESRDDINDFGSRHTSLCDGSASPSERSASPPRMASSATSPRPSRAKERRNEADAEDVTIKKFLAQDEYASWLILVLIINCLLFAHSQAE
jgi:hypothetical protein